MTTKNIALALLAIPAAANQNCAPDAAQSNFALEFAAGSSRMEGDIHSNTQNPKTPEPRFETITFQPPSNEQGIIPVAGQTMKVPLDLLSGYQANWNKMMPLPSQIGFAGQINIQWNYMCNGLGAGLYAGIGLGSSRSASRIPADFNPHIHSYLYDITTTVTGPLEFDREALIDIANDKSEAALQNRVEKTKNIPMGKAVTTSGLMFQVGGRLGFMVGNAFPNVRVGWACYQIKAHMTEQYEPWQNQVDAQARNSNTENPIVLFRNTETDRRVALSLIDPQAPENPSMTIGVEQHMDSFDKAYHMNRPIKISSKHQWTNALTIGAGVDWAFRRMTLGFFYQVGICQRLTFKKWNKEVTAGMTSVSADYIASENVNVNPDGQFKATGGHLKMDYGKSTPEVSIQPVMHTFMLSAKYVIKAA